MIVMWFCNTLIPEVANEIGISYLKPESWITSSYKLLKEKTQVTVIYLYPAKLGTKTINKNGDSFVPYRRWDVELMQFFVETIKNYLPDVIQIFGTENPDVLTFINAAEQAGVKDRIVVNLQGISKAIAEHYTVGLPSKVVNSYTFRDLIRNNNIKQNQNLFFEKAEKEERILSSIKHVIGRTDMDYAVSILANKDILYHKCNEVLRATFYDDDYWKADNCDKHRIFVSQSNYPIKGFHIMLKALAEIVKRYPDTRVYTTGKSPFCNSYIDRLKQTSYSRYIGGLINQYGLRNNVFFLGTLSAEEMKEQYLKANVFVMCSTIENSPNSLGEAMMLGVPTIASDVGGVKNVFVHKDDGFVYQSDAYYMLVHYIMELFGNQTLMQQYSENERKHARNIYDRNRHVNDLMQIYRDISES